MSIIRNIVLFLLLCVFLYLPARAQTGIDTVYVRYDPKNPLIEKETTRDYPQRVEFRVIRHKYRTKEQREAFWREYWKRPYEPMESNFWYTFHTLGEPSEWKSVDGLGLTSIERISRDSVDIGHRTLVYFLERVPNGKYRAYKSLREFAE